MWDKLETFYHVAQAGGFTHAAKVLNLSQSALTRSIQSLEKSLGCKVFIRKHTGVQLTRKGEVVFQLAKKTYLEAKLMKEKIKETSEMSGKIKISTTYALANYVLMDPLLEFKELYPEIEFEIICSDSLVDIIKNEVDIALRPYMKENGEEVEQVPLFTLRPHLYASQSYIDQYGEPQSVEDLHQHYFVAYSRPIEYPYVDIDWYLTLNPKLSEANTVMRINTVEGLFSAAERGLGIVASYDEMTILQKSGLKKILPDMKSPKYQDFLIYPTHLSDIERLKALIKFLKEKFTKPQKK